MGRRGRPSTGTTRGRQTLLAPKELDETPVPARTSAHQGAGSSSYASRDAWRYEARQLGDSNMTLSSLHIWLSLAAPLQQPRCQLLFEAFGNATGVSLSSAQVRVALREASLAASMAREEDRSSPVSRGRPREVQLTAFASVLAADPWRFGDREIALAAGALGIATYTCDPSDSATLDAAASRIQRLRVRCLRYERISILVGSTTDSRRTDPYHE